MSSQTSTVKIEGDIEFFYEDSGTSGLNPNSYTTLVLIHGLAFTGGEYSTIALFPPF